MKNGVYIVDKRWGESSFNVVRNARIKFNTRRVGHTGTLDPLASGILPILVGDATKLSDYLMNHDKEYVAELSLGQRTSTGDSEGKVIEEKPFDFKMSAEKIQKMLNSFIGTTEQIPPMYSAIKVNGTKLYEIARKGETIVRKPRPINVTEIQLLKIERQQNFDKNESEPYEMRITFRVVCSKGTYIRVLCEDIAERLDTVGYMSELRRTRVGKFSEKDAGKFFEMEDIIDCESVELSDINEEDVMKKLTNGVELIVNINKNGDNEELVKIYDHGKFIGFGTVKHGILKRKILIGEDE